jgi:hypothetical protein
MKMSIKYRDINNEIRKVKEQKICMQTTDKRTNHTFYKRTENQTNVVITDIEMQLINKGLKCNLHSKPKKWSQTFVFEAVSYQKKAKEYKTINSK